MPSKPDFAEFYKRHFEAVYRICYIFMQNAADAEDYTIDDIKAAGLDITLPEGAEVIFCNIWKDGQLDVRFSLNGHDYYYSAAETEGDFSGIYGIVAESENIPDTNAVLDTTSEGYFKSRWNGEKYYYCFSNTDGADKDDMISLIKHFTSQAQ